MTCIIIDMNETHDGKDVFLLIHTPKVPGIHREPTNRICVCAAFHGMSTFPDRNKTHVKAAMCSWVIFTMFQVSDLWQVWACPLLRLHLWSAQHVHQGL